MSEYDDATVHSTAVDETADDVRSEAAESADDGPTDLTAAARLLGAGEDEAIGDAADDGDQLDDLGAARRGRGRGPDRGAAP